MKGLFDLSGPGMPPANGAAPDSLVILLHGYGADGNDLIELAPHLAQALPGAFFVSPHAPFPCEMGPFGRQWFSFQDRSLEAIMAGTRAAAPILESFVDELLGRFTLPESRLALIGFSQGTMMALHVAPRRAESCAGVVGFSGRLLDGAVLQSEVRARPPVLLIHGTDDELVPIDALEEASSGLSAAGLAVETHRRPGLGHGIDAEGLALATRFLQEKLGG
ncbi:MAG: alpha/beta fold hydrolase [Alphaproteobacteria bacterium]